MPPYLRDVEPSACWNASKMSCCFSGAMPMPVSATEKATTDPALFSSSLSIDQPEVTGITDSETEPSCVNLNALESRFLMICCMRLMSVNIERGRAGSSLMLNSTLLDSATWRKVRST